MAMPSVTQEHYIESLDSSSIFCGWISLLFEHGTSSSLHNALGPIFFFLKSQPGLRAEHSI